MPFLAPKNRAWLLTASALLGLSTLAYCAPDDYWGLRKIDYELTGRVLNHDTKEPIDGAYVIAAYFHSAGDFSGSSRSCVKTLGMTTGKDGAFNFPPDPRAYGKGWLRWESRSRWPEVYAIKADYFYRDSTQRSTEPMPQTNKDLYANQNVYLKKQDPAKPAGPHEYGFRECTNPDSSEAAEAAAMYLKMVIAEDKKYLNGKNVESYEWRLGYMQRTASANEEKNRVSGAQK